MTSLMAVGRQLPHWSQPILKISFVNGFWGPQFFLRMAADLSRARLPFTRISSQELEGQLVV